MHCGCIASHSRACAFAPLGEVNEIQDFSLELNRHLEREEASGWNTPRPSLHHGVQKFGYSLCAEGMPGIRNPKGSKGRTDITVALGQVSQKDNLK